MKRMRCSTKTRLIISFLLLFSVGQQMSGQKKEVRTYFPINDNTAFIDISGKTIIQSSRPDLFKEVVRVSENFGGFRGPDPESTWISFGEFSEGRARARWTLCPKCRNAFPVDGIIDETGRLVIPPRNSNTRYGSFHEGLAQYFESGWGFIDREGRVAIEAKFYEVSDFSEGLALVRLSEKRKFGYINQKGELVIPSQFAWAGDFHDGLAAVKSSQGQYGFIDKTGKLVLHSKAWLEVKDFSEGLAGVKVEITDTSVYQGYMDAKYCFIDHSGKTVILPRFDRVENFSEGRALFFQTGTNHGYGFIDSSGQIVIKAEYVDGKSFSEGLAAVAIKSSDDRNLWGYINYEGNWVIRPQFQNVDSFNGGLAAVNCDDYGRNCKAYIDAAGAYRWQKLQGATASLPADGPSVNFVSGWQLARPAGKDACAPD